MDKPGVVDSQLKIVKEGARLYEACPLLHGLPSDGDAVKRGAYLAEVCPPFHDLTYLSDLAQQMNREQWRAVSDVAQVVANYLRCHPCVEAVLYPGLKCDPLFEEASHTLVGGFGPIVWYCAAGEWHELTCEPCDAREAVMALEAQLR